MAAGTPGTTSNGTRALAQAAASAAAWQNSIGSPLYSRIDELAGLGRLDEQLRVLRRSAAESATVASAAQQVPDPPGQLGVRDHQVGLAEQGGRAQGQQALVARAGADEGDQARGRLRRRAVR